MSTGAIERVFSTVQACWGLRGDPILWETIKQRVIERGLPESPDQFSAQLAQDYADIVGRPLDDNNDFVAVKSLHTDRGGMSNGMISPQAWRESLLPLLITRFKVTV